jgi:hypothetical protein
MRQRRSWGGGWLPAILAVLGLLVILAPPRWVAAQAAPEDQQPSPDGTDTDVPAAEGQEPADETESEAAEAPVDEEQPEPVEASEETEPVDEAAGVPPLPPVPEPPEDDAPSEEVEDDREEPAYRGPPLEITGSFFNRFEYRDGYRDLGVSGGRTPEGDQTVFRARLGLGVGPMDIGGGHGVFLQFTPQASGSIGTMPGTVAELGLGLHEAYVGVQGDLYRLQVGLIEMDYGEALVIGNLDWHQTARRFQGARVRLAKEKDSWYVDIFATQLVEGVPFFETPFGAGDRYFVGVYSNVGPALVPGLTWDLYALAQLWPSADAVPDPGDPGVMVGRESAGELTLGSRIKYRTGAVDYRLEAGVQTGSRLLADGQAATALAYQGDAEVGVNMLSDRVRVSAHGLYASGNDPASERQNGWNQLFPTAHKFLGLMDIIGPRTNIGSAVAHLQVKPIDRLVVSADAHLFFRPHRADTLDAFSGAETNLNVLYVIGPGFKARALYGTFIPVAGHYPVERVAHYVELELRYDL